MRYLSIDRCPTHQDFWAVSIEDEHGNGTRLTGTKCCGRWKSVRRWPLDERLINDAIDELSAALDESA